MRTILIFQTTNWEREFFVVIQVKNVIKICVLLGRQHWIAFLFFLLIEVIIFSLPIKYLLNLLQCGLSLLFAMLNIKTCYQQKTFSNKP